MIGEISEVGEVKVKRYEQCGLIWCIVESSKEDQIAT